LLTKPFKRRQIICVYTAIKVEICNTWYVIAIDWEHRGDVREPAGAYSFIAWLACDYWQLQ